MAIFEYVCKECQHHFEAITQGSTVPECPACKSRNLDRQLSVFAVGEEAPSLTPRTFGANLPAPAGIPAAPAPARSTS